MGRGGGGWWWCQTPPLLLLAALLGGRGRLVVLVVVLVVVVLVVDGGDDADGALVAERLEAHALSLHHRHALTHLDGGLDEELVEKRTGGEAERERADDRDPRPRALRPRRVVLISPAAQLTTVEDLAELPADAVTHL